MIENQVTDISTSAMGQMTTSVNVLNRKMNELNRSVVNTSETLNQKYDSTNTSIRDLNATYGSESEAKKQMTGKITTFTSDMLNLFQHIQDYVKT